MNKISTKKIYGVVICYNSENVIEDLYNRIDKDMFDKIYFFDDNSTDKSFEIAKKFEWVTFKNEKNLGHGGNLAVAEHWAVDINRLTDKSAISLGNSVIISSYVNDVGFDKYLEKWLTKETLYLNDEQKHKCFVIGISSSGKSKDIDHALNYANNNNMQTSIITSYKAQALDNDINQCILDFEYYHNQETFCLLLMYTLCENYNKKENPKIISGKKKQELDRQELEEIDKGCSNCDYGAWDHTFCDSYAKKYLDKKN